MERAVGPHAAPVGDDEPVEPPFVPDEVLQQRRSVSHSR